MTRRLKNGIVLGICELCRETEVPEAFANWTAISCVATCMERNCFVDQGHFTVYPNLYIVLTAGSARCRKSSSITIAEKLLRCVAPPVHILSQKSTPEALIGDLSGSALLEQDSSLIKPKATGIVIADELSTFIDRKAFDSGMIAVLTKLYDCGDFDYRTRSRGLELVKEPCLSILAGSTLHWIKEAIPIVAIGGGFTARVIFVHQEKRRKNVAWPIRTERELELEKDIIHDLGQVRALRGSFGVTDAAKRLYCDEYNDFCNSSKLFDDPNMSGYAGRRHVVVLKLAMAMSASLKDTREIDELDMALAIKQILMAEQDMQKVLSAISCEPCGSLSEQLVQLIANSQSITKFELIRYFKNKLTISQIDELLRTLVEAKFVELTVIKGNPAYKWLGGKQQ